MKPFLVIILATAVAACSWAAESSPAAKVAVMQNDIVVPDPDPAALPRVQAGDLMSAIRVTDSGYEVVYRDSRGQNVPAFLPFRDEWGHITAGAWTHDLSLSNHTIRIKTSVPLRPLHLRLHAGEKYAVASSDGDTITMLYQAAGGCPVAISIPADAAVLEDVPGQVLGPAEARKRQLEVSLAQRQAEEAQLQEKNRQASDDNARLLALLKQVNEAEVACAVLKAQVAKNDEIRQQLVRYTPETRKAQDQGGQDLAKVVQQQAAPSAKASTLDMEKAGLENVRKELLKSDVELEGLKAKAGRARSELDALVAHLADPAVNAEKEKLRSTLQAEARKEATAAGAVGKSERQRDVQKSFQDQIESVREETAKLQTAIDALTKEIDQLRRDLAGGGGAKQAAQPQPQPKPRTPPPDELQ